MLRLSVPGKASKIVSERCDSYLLKKVIVSKFPPKDIKEDILTTGASSLTEAYRYA